MKRSGIRKNNRGDSLILVIGCIALLSIVGVILLAKTIDNRNMKEAEAQAQESFAGAETGSTEMVSVIETVALDVIEDAFEDMLLEYSLMANDQDRKDRYSAYFKEKVYTLLTTGDDFQTKLTNALGTDVVTNLTVECLGGVDTVASETGYTETVRVRDMVFTYTTDGSQTKITTDICVKAKLPNVAAGFDSGISCDFLDFALISDGSVSSVNKSEDMVVDGNLYVGGDLLLSGSSVDTKVIKATKMLVKNEIKLDNSAGLWVDATGTTLESGEGIWAEGISVSGSTLDTTGVNLYVKDDLAVSGTSPSVVLRGGSAEYVGYSGDSGATINHERSSAININESTSLMMDLSTMGELYINGSSYICENNIWGDGLVEEGAINMKPAEGVLQGESVAYKDMQAMYLFPSSCLPNHNHNPIIGTNVTIGEPSLTFEYQREGEGSTAGSIDLELYLDSDHPYITRTAHLDGGATVATYVYMNFKNEAAAAEYIKLYMETFMGDNIKQQIKNLGSSSRIKLPTNTYTLSNALTYDGTSVTMLPAANATKKNLLNIVSQLAKQREKGLFSSLRLDGSKVVSPSYQMVKDGILSSGAFNGLAPDEEKVIALPQSSGDTYMFYVHNGDLEITDNTYDNKKGILLVNGNLTMATTRTKMEGLILVTGEVTQAAGLDLTANKEVVETLLANEEVAKYFRVYGDESGADYLSTEAVEISFENWKRN